MFEVGNTIRNGNYGKMVFQILPIFRDGLRQSQTVSGFGSAIARNGNYGSFAEKSQKLHYTYQSTFIHHVFSMCALCAPTIMHSLVVRSFWWCSRKDHFNYNYQLYCNLSFSIVTIVRIIFCIGFYTWTMIQSNQCQSHTVSKKFEFLKFPSWWYGRLKNLSHLRELSIPKSLSSTRPA